MVERHESAGIFLRSNKWNDKRRAHIVLQRQHRFSEILIVLRKLSVIKSARSVILDRCVLFIPRLSFVGFLVNLNLKIGFREKGPMINIIFVGFKLIIRQVNDDKYYKHCLGQNRSNVLIGDL